MKKYLEISLLAAVVVLSILLRGACRMLWE